MKKILLFIALILSVNTIISQEIAYDLSMKKPQNHLFNVALTLKNFKESTLLLKLPTWSPGSYLIREFSKNIDLVIAKDENGSLLKVNKKAKNAWEVVKGKAKEVHVYYDVYAFELSVRTSFLDLTHGFVSGSGVFMYVENQLNKKGKLTIHPYEDFKVISTALPTSKELNTYEFENYDQLVDCPIEIGNQTVFNFQAANVNHTVAIYGEGNYDVEVLKKDMAKIVTAATDVFGQNPNKNYTFIVHNVVDGQGGLEHCNSTTLSVNRWTYSGSEYLGFLNLVAHEYFHLWNVKRIRPIELGPFDYDKENYTSLLWVMEGFTSYYDELLMLRAGYYTKDEFLNKLQGTVNYVEGSIGSRVQPLAHASFDAWVKAYRPNEKSGNTTMTYYSRGAMIGALLDAKIIAKYKGEKCLDHFMQQLYADFFIAKKRGFSEAEFKKTLETFLGENLDEFFDKYINGTEIAPLNQVFSPIGLSVKDVTSTKPSFGAAMKQEGGKVIVRSIRSNSAAEDAGLSVNDEIIGLNGYRIDQKSVEDFVATLENGEKFSLLISRDLQLFEIQASVKNFIKPQFLFQAIKPGDRLYNYWLRTN